MTRAFTGFLMLEAVLIGGWAGLAAIRKRVLNRAQVLALMALELLLFVHAAVSIISLSGHDASEPGTHVVYGVGSLLVLPLLVGVPIRLGFPAAPGAPGTDPEFLGGVTIGPPPRPAEDVDADREPDPAPEAGSEPDCVPAADRFRPAVAVLGAVAIVVMLERMWVTWQSGPGT